MTTTTKILLVLLIQFITTSWACEDSTTQKYNKKTEYRIGTNYFSSITFKDGNYLIDTNIILANKNLMPLINLIEIAIEKSDLKDKKTVEEIPVFIKSFLDTLSGNFSIANPGENWQVGCISEESLPSRQLIYLGIGTNIALMAYYTGGIGKSEHILIIKYDNTKIIDFWCGNVLNDLKNKVDILKYLYQNKDKHFGLNTNYIYL